MQYWSGVTEYVKTDLICLSDYTHPVKHYFPHEQAQNLHHL